MLIDVLITSNMGANDGGRETWCYLTLPRLLSRIPEARLRLHYMHTEGKADTRQTLASAFDSVKTRFEPVRHIVKDGPLPKIISLAARVREYYKAKGRELPDFSIAMGTAEVAIQAYVSQLRKQPKFAWLRTIYWDEKSRRIPKVLHRIARHLESHLLSNEDLILTNGDDISAYYAKFNIKSHVIRNGVDLSRWALEPPRFDLPIQVAFIGRLSEAKGIAEFLELAKTCTSRGLTDRLHFHVCGIGPYQKEVELAARDGALTYHGEIAQNRMAQTLASFDICVAFTRSATISGGGGTSNAMMEQLAAGRLLLAWDNPIFQQYLSPSNAILIPQGDVLLAIHTLLQLDRRRGLELASAGRKSVEVYSIENHIEIFERSILSAYRAKRPEKILYNA